MVLHSLHDSLHSAIPGSGLNFARMQRPLQLGGSLHYLLRQTMTVALSLGLTGLTFAPSPSQAQAGLSCGKSSQEIQEKSDLLRASIQGNRKAARSYGDRIKAHREFLKNCRRKNWPQNQAIWLRLYPCDVQPGVLDQVLDQVVNMGYNQVYVEVFYDGRVLLPQSSNPTVWPSVLQQSGQANIDLFQMALDKGRQRGLQVYAWMYTMNFGHSYGRRADRLSVVARNGRGQTSREISGTTETFIDPYSRQAMRDYYNLVQAVIQRRPDGILFDYVRYPRGTGGASAAGNVKDLLIYSPESRQALINRATNDKGRELITRFVDRGYIAQADLKELNQKYPRESVPTWQGRNPSSFGKSASLRQQQEILQLELWLLSVAHAYQGVVDFLEIASRPARQAGIPVGSVFFPGANKPVGQLGFDSRMQPWERFESTAQWHPMAYSTCGSANCIVKEIQDVLNQSLNGVKVKPALAGAWGRSVRGNRPSLEQQMSALRPLSNHIETVSHFAYSWQQPQNDVNRKSCRVAFR